MLYFEHTNVHYNFHILILGYKNVMIIPIDYYYKVLFQSLHILIILLIFVIMPKDAINVILLL